MIHNLKVDTLDYAVQDRGILWIQDPNVSLHQPGLFQALSSDRDDA